MPSLHLGTTAQGLRVINSVDPCVLKSNYYVGIMVRTAGYICPYNYCQLDCYIRIFDLVLQFSNGFHLWVFRRKLKNQLQVKQPKDFQYSYTRTVNIV